MPGFGESLRSEREARNVPIEEIAGETGIHRDYLEALEKNEFQGLPGRSFGKLYIRAYARMLGFDPQPLIDAYDREWQRARPNSMNAPDAGPDASRPVGSLVAGWRQARIAERRRMSRSTGENEASEPNAMEDAVAALESAPPEADPVAISDRSEVSPVCTHSPDPAGVTETTGTADESSPPDSDADDDVLGGVAVLRGDTAHEAPDLPAALVMESIPAAPDRSR